MDEYERDFSNIVRLVPSVATDEREKARKFFTGLNARYIEVMRRNPPTTYIIAVEEARSMDTQFQLTMIQQRRNGNLSNTGGEHKRVYQEGGEPSQQPSYKKSKGNQPSQQPSKPKQSGAQSFSGQHGGNSSLCALFPDKV